MALARALKIVGTNFQSVYEKRRPLVYTPGSVLSINCRPGYNGIYCWAGEDFTSAYGCARSARKHRRSQIRVVELEFDDPEDVCYRSPDWDGRRPGKRGRLALMLMLHRCLVVREIPREEWEAWPV